MTGGSDETLSGSLYRDRGADHGSNRSRSRRRLHGGSLGQRSSRRHATFLQSGGLRCNNYGNRVRCFTGDAYPYAELTDTRRGGVTVKVHTLRDPQGGTLTRTYVRGYPVYVFSAF
jgi:hypothetical protein